MKRQWEVHLDPETGEGYSELEDAVLDLVTILLRCGGVGAIAPHRIEAQGNDYMTDRVMLRYDSYAPGLNREGTAASGNGEVEVTEVSPALSVVEGDGGEDIPDEGA